VVWPCEAGRSEHRFGLLSMAETGPHGFADLGGDG
jgi:hypothetical protein